MGDANTGELDFRGPSAPLDCEPYLRGILRSQLVVTKRGGEAKNALGHSLCELNVGFVVRDGRGAVSVKPTTNALNLARSGQIPEMRARTRKGGQIPRTHNLPLSNLSRDAIGFVSIKSMIVET